MKLIKKIQLKAVPTYDMILVAVPQGEIMIQIKELLDKLYPRESIYVSNEIMNIIEGKKEKTDVKLKWDESDVVLITYADVVNQSGEKPLKTFKKLQQKYISETFSHIHFLPFFPYSSDDGFSVIDYYEINPDVGDWDLVEEVSKNNRLMIDFVCNHMSKESIWFKEYLSENPKYKDFFIEVDPELDYSSITRPRTSSLYHKYKDIDDNIRYIWTTFSEDQIDLNFKNPEVLLEMLRILSFYIDRGAEYIRLDAVGFLWKKLNTSSMHLEETHQVIQLMRHFVDKYAPGVVLITETNVPHLDNISYFGNGYNEAQMVYQFTLPPLLLHSLHTENTTTLTQWAKTIKTPSKETTFFNFLASHDGIGLNPVRGILDELEILELVERVKENGAQVSYKKNPDGSESPYEMNVTYYDAVKGKGDITENIDRFILLHAILLSLPGVPAIYFNSYFGCENDQVGFVNKGYPRAINREKFEIQALINRMMDENSGSKIRSTLEQLIKTRRKELVFHPDSEFEVIDKGDSNILWFTRSNGNLKIECIYNFTNESRTYSLNDEMKDIVTDKVYKKEVNISPYGFVWLKNRV